MFAALFEFMAGGLRRKLRALTVTAVLLLVACAALLTAAGFGLALLYTWLQGLYGTLAALAIVGGGCAGLALILILAATLRPSPRRRAPPPSGDRAMDEAIAAIKQGSRESMLAALTLAVLAGVNLGRRI